MDSAFQGKHNMLKMTKVSSSALSSRHRGDGGVRDALGGNPRLQPIRVCLLSPLGWIHTEGGEHP